MNFILPLQLFLFLISEKNLQQTREKFYFCCFIFLSFETLSAPLTYMFCKTNISYYKSKWFKHLNNDFFLNHYNFMFKIFHLNKWKIYLFSAQPLSPDFFLPEEVLRSFPDYDSSVLYGKPPESAGGSPSSSAESVFNKIKSLLSEELVKKTAGVYAFNITGKANLCLELLHFWVNSSIWLLSFVILTFITCFIIVVMFSLGCFLRVAMFCLF